MIARAIKVSPTKDRMQETILFRLIVLARKIIASLNLKKLSDIARKAPDNNS